MTDKKKDNVLDRALNHPLSRRSFIQVSGAAAGTVAASGVLLKSGKAGAATPPPADDLETDAGIDVRYSVCLGCHSKCGMRVRIKNDTVLKVDGNPWHPNNAETGERLDFDDTLDNAKTAHATLCPKGQAGPEVMYNPFRIKQPLRRAGARGSGQWEEITWDEALNEIAAKIKPYYDAYDAGDYIMGESVLGTKANMVAFSPGRLQHGQKEFTDRVWKMGFGTINNRHDHTSICETTHHVAGDFHAEKKKHHWQPNIQEAEYILWFGTNPLEANFPSQTLAKRIAASARAGVKHVVIDPRHSRTAIFADRWVPIKVGGDAALAMGIAQRIISAGNHDASFLEAANNLAALALIDSAGNAKDKQYNPTDATYLVTVKGASADDEWLYLKSNGNYVIVDPTSGAQAELDRDKAAAAQYGRLEIDAGDTGAATAAAAGLDADVVGDHVIDVNGDGSVYAAPVFQLYKARVNSYSMDRYAFESGVDKNTIATIADEFAAAGRKAVADTYRGGCQHTHGMGTMQAILTLNTLVGNYDWKGGNMAGTGGHLHEDGSHGDPGQMNLKSVATSSRSPSGPQITRVKSFYSAALQTALGESSPRRPWFPFAYNGNYQELLPSIEDRYPYPLGALFSYWNNIPWSTPASRETAYRVLTDESVLPLHVNFDIEMGEMASFADYVLPDSSYFERWSTPHNAPQVLGKASGFRSPVVGYYANKIGTNGKTYWESVADGDLQNWKYTIDWATESGPFTIEDILLELMKRVGGGSLAGVDALGDNAYYASAAELAAAGHSPSHRNDLNTAFDHYWNMMVNWACEAGVDKDAAADINAFIQKVVERGGYFQDTALDGTNEYDGDYMKNRMNLGDSGKALHLFYEYADGGKRYVDAFSNLTCDPLPNLGRVTDSMGNLVDDGPEFGFNVVSYKPMYHSQGRTDSLPSLTMLEPENFVEMNTADARRLGVWDGDMVNVASASYTVGLKGRVKVTESIRPGVVAISHSRGHWEINSRSYTVDGVYTQADRRRGRGLNSNPFMRTDPVLKNVTLQDPIGGSAAFYDTKVKIEKVLG